MLFKNKTLFGILKSIVIYSLVFLTAMNLMEYGFEYANYNIASKDVYVLLFTLLTFGIYDLISDLIAKRKKSKLDSNIINP